MNACRRRAHTRSRNLDGNWDMSPLQVFRLALWAYGCGSAPAFHRLSPPRHIRL